MAHQRSPKTFDGLLEWVLDDLLEDRNHPLRTLYPLLVGQLVQTIAVGGGKADEDVLVRGIGLRDSLCELDQSFDVVAALGFRVSTRQY